MNENYKPKAPQSFNHRTFTKEEYNGVLSELERLTLHHNYTGAFKYAMQVQFTGTAKDVLKTGLEFYKKNKLYISYNQLVELGVENGFEKYVKDITSKLK